MNPRATLANVAWWLSCLPAWWKFRRALNDPAAAQEALRRQLVGRAADTAFGLEHNFCMIRDYGDFAAKVPVRDYGELFPWIDRVRLGQSHVLTPDPVIRLATTSGTTSARKLIPYTRSLQAEFNRAVGPWIVDLFQSDPRLMAGTAYWSITPVLKDEKQEESAVPIGFEEDSEYLGGLRRKLIDWTMAVGPEVRHAATLDEFRHTTMEQLNRRRDLRFISVWHPSFLGILLAGATREPAEMWPGLRAISCWADGHSAVAAGELQKRFPGVRIQPKGLIATEAIVSIPFAGKFPLAVTSHFLEFVDGGGQIRRAHELTAGNQYEVLVTTGGGLWRYRLNDLVRVDGFLGQTPSIRFVGKTGHISDRFGEKLSEALVSQVLARLRTESQWDGPFAMLAPRDNVYVLYIQGMASPTIARRLDELLRENPHYAYCRDLGQLGPPRVFLVSNDAGAAMLARLSALGQRLGDIKAMALSPLDGWGEHFSGEFLNSPI